MTKEEYANRLHEACEDNRARDIWRKQRRDKPIRRLRHKKAEKHGQMALKFPK